MIQMSKYQSCIDACISCASACNYCASSCLKDEDVKMMARCIQLDMECAAICYATAEMMSLDGQFAEHLCGVCAEICQVCADECSKHNNDHCKACAAACNICAAECRKMAGVAA